MRAWCRVARLLRLLLVSLMLPGAAGAADAPVGRGAAAAAAEAADARLAAALRAHTAFLAHDLLEGRDTGTRGFAIAAEYVASQFAQHGILPAGTHGYLQPVPLRRRSLEAATMELRTGGTRVPLANGEDIAIDASAWQAEEHLDLPLVFVGWGITAPALGLDDYRDVDVRGKAVVLVEGAPSHLPGALRAHFTWIQQKERMAADAGAAAVLTVKSPARDRVSPWERTRRLRPLPAMHWHAERAESSRPPVRATATLSPAIAARLFNDNGLDLAAVLAAADGNAPLPPSRALDASLRIQRNSRHEDMTSPNVVGLLPGSDPALADEVVLVLAHLDHVGIGAPVAGDAIYNGAVDNAGGVAVMLEAARSLRARDPRRSILFVATTGEERGLIGADYFAAFPTVARERIVAAISVDGLMAFHDFEDIVSLGSDHSNLGEASAAAAAAIGARHVPDPIPERGNLALSDQYPFLRAGIPVLFPNPGPRDPATGADEHPAWTAYETGSYHQPSDDLSLPLRWDVAARWARYIEHTLYGIANGPRPAWYSGDPVAQGFAPDAPAVARPATLR